MSNDRRNYLLGNGERLTEKVEGPKRPVEKIDPYSFNDAIARLAPRIEAVAQKLDELPSSCCPNEETVAVLTLHPGYLAKSYFPTGLLRAVGLNPVGSRAVTITPEKTKSKKQQDKDGKPKAVASAEIYVSGKRRAFKGWATSVKKWTEDTLGADEIKRIENIRWIDPDERLKPMCSDAKNPLLEIVLHAGANDGYILDGFVNYMNELGVEVDLDRRIYASGLCFLPVRVPLKKQKDMAKFSFLRVAREMPQLRGPAADSIAREATGIIAELPAAGVVDPQLRVALFDGGIPKVTPLTDWVRRKKTQGIGNPVQQFQDHGLAVTSALLFGPIEDGVELMQPFAMVDHYRVLDKDTLNDPQDDYYDVLERVVDILQQEKYDFVNLSIGPNLPVEDNDVHSWTAKLDELFADGQTLVCVAAGNSGELDRESGNARIQAPSDGVNVLSIGACDSLTGAWDRAPYSSIGPGRSPGFVKPEIVAFGGTESQPFLTVKEGTDADTIGIWGTSFASPLALRTALGIRAILGSTVQPLALKTLLIHHSDNENLDKTEVGWGRIPINLDDLITCKPGTASILYQGWLEPGKYLRAKIPMPTETIRGKVAIKATFCYATETDPKDALNYTRAGLEVVFRPHMDKKSKEDQKTPDTRSFFSSHKKYKSEEELRRDEHKWETCMKDNVSMLGKSLVDPVFDIHYMAREGGAPTVNATRIPYALVVTVETKNMVDLYEKIANRYRLHLKELKPIIRQQITI